MLQDIDMHLRQNSNVSPFNMLFSYIDDDSCERDDFDDRHDDVMPQAVQDIGSGIRFTVNSKIFARLLFREFSISELLTRS